MKCLYLKNNFINNLLFSFICFILINAVISLKEAPKINIYKTDENVKNSLFKERNSFDRISVSTEGVPMKDPYFIIN